MKPNILSYESDWKKLTLELPRDATWDDIIEAFNLILSFKTFQCTVQDMVKEEIIYNYEEENSKRINDGLLTNNIL